MTAQDARPTDARDTALHAALPMYDWPEVSPAWDHLWTLARQRIADAGIEAEPALRRDGDYRAGWLAPGLLLGQTCGWPYVSLLRGQVEPVGRLDFGLQVIRPGDYHSVFVMREGSERADPRDLAPLIMHPGTVVAINDTLSQSGCRVLGECLPGPMTVPKSRVLFTGGHRASIRAVAAGEAAIAAIDAVSWRLALRHEPAAAGLAVVARSADAPGLPLIMAAGLKRHRAAVREALSGAVAALPQEVRLALGLRGVVPAADDDYCVLTASPFGDLRIG